MLKIGIFTHYYKSVNYGGNLQAYALCEFLNKNGYHAEQISFNRKNETILIKNKRRKHLFVKVLLRLKSVLMKFFNKKLCSNIKKRNECIRAFNEKIPHSAEKKSNDLCSIGKEYDCFITGSDQVWHPQAVCDGYLLNFNASYKMSYAASFSTKALSPEVEQYYSRCLQEFDAISVREELAVDMARRLSGKGVSWVVDPTLLLTSDDWNNITSERIIKEKYIFCFFLGNLSFDKKIIQEFAEKRNLNIVCMPYLSGLKNKGATFGNILKYDVSPQDFLSLIKYSEYIFTDSFHATVFSHIFNKSFFVFNRSGVKTMNDRIYSLTELFGTQNRFCDAIEKESLEYIESLPEIDYNVEFSKFAEMRDKSIEFLKDNLKKAEEKVNGIN